MLLNDYSIIHSIVSKDYELLRSALAMGADDALILVALEISRTLCDPAEISEFILHQVKHECFVKFIESKDHCVDLLRAIVRGDNKAFGKVVVDPAMMQLGVFDFASVTEVCICLERPGYLEKLLPFMSLLRLQIDSLPTTHQTIWKDLLYRTILVTGLFNIRTQPAMRSALQVFHHYFRADITFFGRKAHTILRLLHSNALNKGLGDFANFMASQFCANGKMCQTPEGVSSEIEVINFPGTTQYFCRACLLHALADYEGESSGFFMDI